MNCTMWRLHEFFPQFYLANILSKYGNRNPTKFFITNKKELYLVIVACTHPNKRLKFRDWNFSIYMANIWH